jgi:hypothetical protein
LILGNKPEGDLLRGGAASTPHARHAYFLDYVDTEDDPGRVAKLRAVLAREEENKTR